MRLSPHFTLAEFTRSATAEARRIDNRMPAALRPAAEALCREILEPLRAFVGRPVVVTSGYRSPALNRAIAGSSATSQHQTGEAADIRVPGYTPAQLFELISRSGLPYDQLIEEHGAWVHVSFSRARRRRQRLLARTQHGALVYLRPPALAWPAA